MTVNADDHFLILELLARYNWAIDGRLPESADVWADVFTSEGRFMIWVDPAIGVSMGEDGPSSTSTTSGVGADPLVSLCGRTELRAFARRAQRARSRPGFHYVDNVIITGDAERAEMRCYLRSVLAETEDMSEQVMGNGYYRDHLRKIGGEWKFESRSLFVGPQSAEGVAT